MTIYKRHLLKLVMLCAILLVSCNPKKIFYPSNTIRLVNNTNGDLNCIVKTKELNKEFTLGKGFFYEINGVKYNEIIKSQASNFEKDSTLILVRVDRDDNIETMELLRNVIQELMITDQNENVIFQLEDINEAYIDIVEFESVNYIYHDIFIDRDNTRSRWR